jgi:hypothetical protein
MLLWIARAVLLALEKALPIAATVIKAINVTRDPVIDVRRAVAVDSTYVAPARKREPRA